MDQKNTLLLLTIFFSLLLFSCAAETPLPEKGLCAHRGANNTHPENTLPAFKEAIQLGAQMIEFDVRQTQDKHLVIMHDETLDRTTNGTGAVTEKNFDYIRSLDAGSWKSDKFTGTKVPTFQETLDMMPRNIWLNIHIKGDPQIGAEIANIVVKEKRLHQSVLACSYDMAQTALKVNDNILICNMDRQDSSLQYTKETIQNNCEFLQLKTRADSVLDQIIPQLHANNVKINYFSCNSPVKMKLLFNAGVDFILTDKLAELMSEYKHSAQH